MNVWHVQNESLIGAWVAACETVRSRSSPGDLIIATAPPLHHPPAWLASVARAHGVENPFSVATVLCPKVVLEAHPSAEDALNSGIELLGRGRRRGLRYSGWRHTYFERLTGQFIDSNGASHTLRPNRLLSVADKINRWPVSSEAGLFAHTALDGDALRTRGSPCLQYIQFRTFGGDKFSLMGVYRSHDYSNKALGNLIGLSRIAKFIEIYSTKECVEVSVVSNNPHLGISKTRAKAYSEEVCDRA